MNRDEVLETLRKHKQVLQERFDVTGLALYGSFARNQATPDSDVDVLVKFAGSAELAPLLRRPSLPGGPVQTASRPVQLSGKCAAPYDLT